MVNSSLCLPRKGLYEPRQNLLPWERDYRTLILRIVQSWGILCQHSPHQSYSLGAHLKHCPFPGLIGAWS